MAGRVWVSAVLAVLLSGSTIGLIAGVPALAPHLPAVSVVLAGGVAFALLACWCRRSAGSVPYLFILVVTLFVQIPGLFAHPLTSDDAYRYVWDGRVQLAGIDPYRYVPLDPALDGLRDPVLFPPEGPRLNRPHVPTIYPPVAQLWFAGWALITPWRLGTLGVQVGALLAVVATTMLLARFMGERRGWALLYGACPVVAVEAANGAHVDALAALCVVGLGWAATRGRAWRAGVFLGLAAGIKLVPLLLVPVFLSGRRWRTTVAAVGVLAASYLPHLIAVGALVLGFLPGYVDEEGFDGERRFALLVWLPTHLRTPVALVVAAAAAVLAVVRSRREPVLMTCCWLYGVAFVVATPIYPWYALPYVVLVLMARRLEWLALWAAAYVGFVLDFTLWGQAAGYLVAVLVIVTVGLSRWQPDRPVRHRAPTPLVPER